MEKIELKNRGSFLLFCFSMLPGAGHMYLGLMNKGVLILGLFSLIIGIILFLDLTFFAFLLPVIWVYSFFDVMNLKHKSSAYDVDINKYLDIDNIVFSNKHLGYILIGLGGILALQRVVYPILVEYMGYQLANTIKYIFISSLFILLGFFLLYGDSFIKEVKKEEEKDENNQ